LISRIDQYCRISGFPAGSHGSREFELCFSLSQPPVPPEKAVEDEPPPFLGTWRRVYIVVVCYLAIVIAAFYAFSRAVTP